MSQSRKPCLTSSLTPILASSAKVTWGLLIFMAENVIRPYSFAFTFNGVVFTEFADGVIDINTFLAELNFATERSIKYLKRV